MRTLIAVEAGLTPVKGTRHLSRSGLDLDPYGVVGDRTHCFVDVERARVLRTVQHPRLMALVADPVEATPTGERITCDYWGRSVSLELVESPLAQQASRIAGTPVRLARAGRAGVVYAGPGLTLVGSASLRDLAEVIGAPVDPARFRASVVVETSTPYEEEGWAGEEVLLGTARLRIGAGVGRCAVIDHDPVTGVRDARLLKALAAHRPGNRRGEPLFAVYAEVVAGGRFATEANIG